MTKNCTEIRNKFYDKFRYFPNAPFEVVMEEIKASNEYCKVLQHCIETGIDETIKMYGTEPPTSFGLPDIIVD